MTVRILEPSSQTILPPANYPTFQLLCLQESRSRQKILAPPAQPHPDCSPRPRWSRARDWKRGVTKRAQFLAEGRKASAIRQDPIRLCHSPRPPLVAKTTARNRAGQRGQRLLVAESAPAIPNRYMLLSAVWSFPESLQRGARFH